MKLAPRWLLFCVILTLAWPTFAAAQASADDEAAIAQQLRGMLTAPETAQARTWAAAYTDYVEHTRDPHPDHAQLQLPRFHIQALARQVLQRWDAQRRLSEFAAHKGFPAKRLATADARQARASWLRSASLADFARFQESINVDMLDEEALQVLIERAPRQQDWLQLARTAQSASSLRLLADAHGSLSAEHYAELLDACAQNPALTGAASLWRGASAKSQPLARQALLQRLDDDTWTAELVDSAIAAQIADLETRLIDRLTAGSGDDPAIAAYGLWRLDTDMARAALHDYVDQPLALPHLRREILLWLE